MAKWTVWNFVLAAAALLLSPSSSRAEDKNIVETAVGAGSFHTLVTAVQAADLVATLQGPGPFTVFAPTDEAFAKLPKETLESLLKPENKGQLASILTYHVVSGRVMAKDVIQLSAAGTVNGQRVKISMTDGRVQLNQAYIVKTDIPCSNGVIHVIDTVLLPSTDNIPQTADKAGKFKTLLAAAKAAGLVEALSGKDALTVFAPTDEAFAKLPAGTVESLLKPENKAKLADILKLHVVSGRVYSTDLLTRKEATSLQGQSLKAAVIGGKATVNGAGLVATDIDASNGVIHVIDTVILPAAAQPVSKVSHETYETVRSVCQTTGRVTYHRVRVVRTH